MLDTPWRRIAASIFDAPDSGRILVSLDVNVEPIERYVTETAAPGRRLHLLHFVAAAAARTIAQDVPALNGYLERGRVRARRGVTVSITTPLADDRGLLATPLRDAHRSSASELAATLRTAMRGMRDRVRDRGHVAEYVLARVPWPLRRPAFRAARGLAGLGAPMARFDFAPDSYGALVLSSIEPMTREGDALAATITGAFVPLMPAARNATGVAILAARGMPCVVDGELTVQRRATLCLTMDHRLADGHEVGLFCRGVLRRLGDPAALDQPVPDLPEVDRVATP